MKNDFSDKPDQPMEMQVHLSPDIQRGVYANQLMVSHNQEEFVMDFILATPPIGVVNARVLVSPGHAKRIARILQENVARYESMFGEIRSIQTSQELPAMPDHIKFN